MQMKTSGLLTPSNDTHILRDQKDMGSMQILQNSKIGLHEHFQRIAEQLTVAVYLCLWV